MARERSIIFCADDVRAIRERRKTQFRRVVKAPKIEFHQLAYSVEVDDDDGDAYFLISTDAVPCLYGKCGERLRVRAPWQVHDKSPITLKFTSLRVERLREITEADAIAEGIRALPGGGYGINERFSAENTAREAFAVLWNSRSGKRAPWASNPWVWVVDFCLMVDEQEAA